jgi:hypothetical protein
MNFCGNYMWRWKSRQRWRQMISFKINYNPKEIYYLFICLLRQLHSILTRAVSSGLKVQNSSCRLGYVGMHNEATMRSWIWRQLEQLCECLASREVGQIRRCIGYGGRHVGRKGRRRRRHWCGRAVGHCLCDVYSCRQTNTTFWDLIL